jgi:FkbM family methyltransferase
MRLGSRWKDWRRRRALGRAGIGVEVDIPTFAAGARSGTWVVASADLGPASVVWSAGVGDNVAWDLALIERFGCRVQAFDPTPRARAWLAAQALPERFVFHAVGLAAFDGEQPFAAPARVADVNFRPLAARAPGSVLAPVRRIATLARELGQERIDVLKLDIEGGEYEVLDDLLASGPLPHQILVEFHHGQHGIPLARTLAAIAALRARGYRTLHISPRGLEFTFVHAPGTAGRGRRVLG